MTPESENLLAQGIMPPSGAAGADCVSVSFPVWLQLTSATPEMHDTSTNGDDIETENKIINEEYKIWKKNAVFLYDIMYRYIISVQ